MGTWRSLKTDGGTGWKSIYRAAGTGWKALDWDSVPIDVGGACINRDSWGQLGGYTYIDKNNPANTNGTLTNVCIYIQSVGGGGDLYVGVFYPVRGTTYKCRSATNVGTINLGNNNKAVSLTIQTGDLIGVYAAGTIRLEKDASGDGRLYKDVNGCIVDSEHSYISKSSYIFSVYGTG